MKVNQRFFVVLAFFFTLFLSVTVSYAYTIDASAGAGGSIWPTGPVPVDAGDDQTFTITPDAGYEILDVVTDSGSVGPIPSYTFPNVMADNSITASFSACPDTSPVKLQSSGSVYNTIMEAYGIADPLGDTIMLKAGAFPGGDLFFDQDVSVVFDGGKNCSFQNDSLLTAIPGSITISGGTVVFSNIVLSSLPPCALGDPNNFPGNTEICDGLDNDCDGVADNGLSFDNDHDGYTAIGSCSGSADDCNDNNPNIHPFGEIYGDGIDQDCDGYDLLFPVDQDCFGGCHVGDVNIDYHQSVSAPDPTCADCHAPQVDTLLPGHYGQTVRTAGNNMNAGDVIHCTSCHDWHDQDYYTINGADIVWSKIYAVPPGYPANLNNLTCDACHEDRAALHATDTAHDNRVIDSVCGQCHTSDTSVLGQPGNGSLISNADVDMLHRSDCALCHNYTGTKIWAVTVEQAIVDGMNGIQIACTTCHGTAWDTIHAGHTHTVEVGPNDLSYDPPGILCSSCHVVADWSEIEGVEHNVATNGAGSCATCHNSPRQEVMDAIVLGANPTHCLDCHSNKELTPHGNIDHVAAGYVTVGLTSCASCHDPGGAANATISVTHNGNCSLCHTSVPDLQPGVPAGGGDCTTCHGSDYFPNHSHHNGTNNDVGYDPAVDTSQASETGCAICHHDYDNANATSLGLGTWETILVEHDLDGTKDGSTNTCDNCHAYDGSSSAPQFDVQQAIANGNPATCATCHTDKVPNVDHGVPTTGKHVAHLALSGVGCATCHDTGNIPCFKSGTDNGDGCYDLAETDVCDACHQDATGNPVTGFKNGWYDPAFALDCSGCHAVAPTTGSHTSHLILTDCGSCHDGTVAGTTAPVQHTDQNIDVYDISPGDLGYPVDKTIGSAYATCSSTYCHSTAQGMTDPTDPPVYVASPTWGTPFVDTEATCTGCHDSGGHVGDASSPLTTGSHAKHLQFRFDQDATCNACHFDWSYTGCTTCHQRQVNHVNNSIDVMFNPEFPWSAASSSGAYTGDPAPQTPYGTCSSLYCHSPGTEASAPYDAPNVTTLAWGGAAMPADCTGCHDGDSASSQPMATGSHAPHIGNYDCSKCHANTVDNSRSLNATIYPPKNYTYGQRYHVDGWVTVAFSSDIATSGAYAGMASPTTYRAPGSAAGSCANTYCHSDGSSVSTAVIPDNTSSVWGSGALSCDGCHSYPPAYDSGTPKANSHAAHASFTCDICHSGTTTTGDTITNPANHANQTYDVQAGSGVTFSYTFDSNGGTCANISCHGTGDGVWGQSGVHTVAVGSGDLSNGTLCAVCHVVSNWAEIEGTEHNVATNGSGSCATCHNSPRPEVIDAIALGADPTNCLDCHANKTAAHGSVDHVAYGYVTLRVNPCGDCHDPGSAENATVDVTHVGDCTLCHTTVPNLQPGIPAGGGDCATCHGSDVQSVHLTCATCHGEPPNGTTSPNTEGGHTEHNALGFGSVNPNCGACHDGATHYSGNVDADILSNFNAQSGAAVVNGDGTCSSTRCHGGQDTPDWNGTIGIDVNTDCESCHKRRTSGSPDEYNDYYSGRHRNHTSRSSIDCWDCHSITKLATGHFSNLETSTFELDPGATIGGSDTRVGSYNGTTCSNIECHGSETW